MQNIELTQIDFKTDFKIINEKQYTLETGEEISTFKHRNKTENKKDSKKSLSKNKKVNSNCGNDINVMKEITEVVDKAISNKGDKHNKIENIQNIEIKSIFTTKNSFIDSVNKSNEMKKQQEKEELNKIDKELPYIARPLLTKAELQLFNFMSNNLIYKDRVHIFPKVRLADIIDVDPRFYILNKGDKKAFYKISSKHVDFVITEKDDCRNIICVVELDDYTHDTEEAKQRDELVAKVLNKTNIDLIRIKTKITEISTRDLRGIEEKILMRFRKRCSYCGADTVVKSSGNAKNFGHRFYSCAKYPECRWSMDID